MCNINIILRVRNSKIGTIKQHPVSHYRVHINETPDTRRIIRLLKQQMQLIRFNAVTDIVRAFITLHINTVEIN